MTAESGSGHRHWDDDRVEAAARALLDGPDEAGLDELEGPAGCVQCRTRVAERSRYLGLARLMTRDTRAPFGAPAVEAVRAIRRRSYRRRALGEIAAILTTPTVKGQA